MTFLLKKYPWMTNPLQKGFVVWGLLWSLSTAAQQRVLRPLPADSLSLSEWKKLELGPAYADSLTLIGALETAVKKLRSDTYYEAALDTLYWTGNIATAVVHIGPPYHWLSLRNGNVEEAFLTKSGFRAKLFRNKPLTHQTLVRMQEQVLQQAENNGYPFAAVHLDSVRIAAGEVSASLMIDKGAFVYFDSLTWEGGLVISSQYLRNYLGIHAGQPYNRRLLIKSQDRLRDLPFLREQRRPEVVFDGQQAHLKFFLEKKKASRFDFLLGLLPDNTRPDRKFLLTGTLNAELQNAFGRGERLFVQFERLRPQTQKLELAVTWPYLLDLPFGLETSFRQYKRDSTYTDITGHFGVQYLLQGGSFLKVFWQTTASNLLEVDTQALLQGKAPEQLDLRNNDFGLELNWQRLDYRYNPRRGFSAVIRGSAGNRKVRRNQSILNVAENFYDTLAERSSRFVAEARINRFLPLGQRSTALFAIDAGWLFSEVPVYRNEQYRIGGSRRLRGFDEESVFATAFSIFTLEWRWLTGQNSNFYLFGDWAYVEDRRSGAPSRYERLASFGTGLNFETTAGVFSLGVAFGKRQENPMDWRNPKVHFGYVSIF